MGISFSRQSSETPKLPRHIQDTRQPSGSNKNTKASSTQPEKSVPPSEPPPAYVRDVDTVAFSTKHKVPVENQDATLDNYVPKNASQEVAKQKAMKFCSKLENARAQPMGLLLYGTPGVGKTHLAVAIAKEAEQKGLKVAAIFGQRFPRLPSSDDYDLLVADDVNSGYGASDFVQGLVYKTHDKGGAVVLTSNRPDFEKMLEEASVTNSDNLPRLKDRSKGLFVEVAIEGDSHRATGGWDD